MKDEQYLKAREEIRKINENLAIWAHGASKVMQQVSESIRDAFKNVKPPSNE